MPIFSFTPFSAKTVSDVTNNPKDKEKILSLVQQSERAQKLNDINSEYFYDVGEPRSYDVIVDIEHSYDLFLPLKTKTFENQNTSIKRLVAAAIIDQIGTEIYLSEVDLLTTALDIRSSYEQKLKTEIPFPIPENEIPSQFKKDVYKKAYAKIDEEYLRHNRRYSFLPSANFNIHFRFVLNSGEVLDTRDFEVPLTTLILSTRNEFSAELMKRSRESKIKSVFEQNDSFESMTGIQFEDFCSEFLRRKGFEVIEKTRVTGDQGVDLIAVKEGMKIGVQCKGYSSPVGNSAVQEAIAGKAYYQCHVALVMTNNRFTSSAKDLADKAGVVLWDRDYILSQISNM